MRPIQELNQLGPDEFGGALSPLFEAAAPLAKALYDERPFVSYAELFDWAESLVLRLTRSEQIEIVNAHPRIGEDPETVRRMSAQSFAEQGYAAEAQLPADEVHGVYAALAALNAEYENRFGFGFVVFVNGRPKSEIVEVLRERLHNSREAELETALRAMFLIARDRHAAHGFGAQPLDTPGVASHGMQQQGDDAARLAVLDELRRSALDTYGEERCAETSVQAALGIAATAVWRVSQELLEPLGFEPLPTDV